MTVKLYVRNDGTQYIGINTAAGADVDTHLIRPGDSAELIFDDDATQLTAKALDADAVAAVNLLKYPPPAPQSTEAPAAPPAEAGLGSVEFVAFTAENPTIATLSTDDAGELKVGSALSNFKLVSGSRNAIPKGATATVSAISGNQVTLSLDLSTANVTNLVATADVT
jgi:hypothetical protein